MAKNQERKNSKQAEKEPQKTVLETPEKDELSEQETTPEVTEAEINQADTLAVEYEELKQKYEKLNKEYLLSLADFDNYRKRTLREKADLLKSGGEQCLKNMLPIIDDFERGILSIGQSSDIEAVKEGLMLIYNKFVKYLEQNGVKEITTKDQDFTTEYHEAVTTFPVPTPEQKGKIIDCVQKGYTLNDKVLRYAKVVVGE